MSGVRPLHAVQKRFPQGINHRERGFRRTDHRVPLRGKRRLFTLLALLVLLGMSFATGQTVSGDGDGGSPGSAIFPPDHAWNTRVDELPVHPLSDEYITAIGGKDPLHPDFGSGTWDGFPIGIPYNVVSADQPRVPVTFEYDDESDQGPYPIPSSPLIEGNPDGDADRHLLIVDPANHTLYELYAVRKVNERWYAGSGAIFSLDGYDLRPAGWTSADAAGLAILPGLVRYEEVASGSIHHAIRVTAPVTRKEYVWPARHFASDVTDISVPPMGQRFRLKAGVDTGPYSPEVRVILQALKEYGIILADNGAPWYITGVPDERWDNDALHALHNIRGSDFEAVDGTLLMVDPDSGKAKQPGSDYTPPGPVSRCMITGSTPTSLTCEWKDPADPDFSGVILTMPGRSDVRIPAGICRYTVDGLIPDTLYTFSFYTFDRTGNKKPDAVSLRGKTPAAPGISLFSVTPSKTPAGWVGVLQVTGTGFTGTTKANLTGPGGRSFQAARITVKNQTTILALFRVPRTAPSGEYNLTITLTNGGYAVLPGSFLVTRLPPQISRVTPSFGRQGSIIPYLVIRGSGLYPGDQIVLSLAGSPDIQLSGEDSAKPGILTGRLVIPADAPPGRYSLAIEDDNGRYGLREGAFLVRPAAGR